MTRLLIDVSPMVVNRTAMYFVVRDSVRHLLDRFPLANLAACGVPVDRRDFIANDFRLDPATEDEARDGLGRLLDGRTSLDVARDRRLRSGLTIVFDPLYLATIEWTSRVVVYVLDLTPVTYPQWHDARVSLVYSRAFDLLAHPSVRTVAISESTRRDLWANYGIEPSTTTVVPLYDRFDRSSRRFARAQERTLLFVGSLEERKNVRGLMTAFEASGLADQGWALHIVGRDGTGATETRRYAARVPNVFLLGALSDEELEIEYTTASALVYPSYWEGFGLPAVEALSRRIPCLLASTGALPEVGGALAIYVDPCSTDSIRRGLIEVTRPETVARIGNMEVERIAQIARFTRERYTQALDRLVDRELDEIHAITNDASAAAGEVAAGQGVAMPLARRERWKRRAIETLLRLRIMEATAGPVPPDSLSADYLYGIQQEKRLNLSRAIASLRVRPLRSWPRIVGSIVLRYLALLLTNAYVASQINELTLLRVSTRRSATDE